MAHHHEHEHEIRRHSNHSDLHRNPNTQIRCEQYNDAINKSQASMIRNNQSYQHNNNQYLHQQNQLNHNYNNHKPYNFCKFNKCPLSLEDQIYLIFYKQRNQSLFSQQIKQELYNQFGTNNVDYSDVKRLRFLHLIEDGSFKMHIKLDDICRNGFNCTIQREHCHRIHAIIKRHICYKLLQYKSCYDNNCGLIHYPQNRKLIRNIILELILFIYNKHLKQNKGLMLENFCISDREFVDTYCKFHRFPPIPNITHLLWKRIIGLYSRYYYDYQQQSDDPANMGSFVFLWKTEFDHDDRKTDQWHIKIHQKLEFFEERTCHHWIFHGIDHQKYMKCHFVGRYFCPYFHLDSIFVSVDGHCKDCIYGRGRCDRFHFKNPDWFKVSYPLPATCWTRPRQQLKMEINEIMNGNYYKDINLIMMNENDIECHNKWCNKLDFILNQHRNRYKNTAPITDNNIDHGFHYKFEDGIDVFWNQSEMGVLKPLQIIQGLFHFFDYNYNQKITDIDLPGIEKVIILRYNVEAFKDVFIKMANSTLKLLENRWCFNREISFKVNYDGFYMIFEFSNINTFLSVKSMKEWFHSFITNYGQFFGDKLLSFDSGSYHFVYHEQLSLSSKATVYFHDIDMNPESLTNPKINGISIKLSHPLHHTEFSKNIHHIKTKVMNYGDPKIYSYLRNNDKLYLHDQQSNDMNGNNANIVQKIYNQQTIETVQSVQDHHMNENKVKNAKIVQKIYNQETVQNVQNYAEYESSNDSPPPNNYKNSNINNNNDNRMQRVEHKQDNNERINNEEIKNPKYECRVYEYDYSDSSDDDEACFNDDEINNNNGDIESKMKETITNKCCNNKVIGNTNIKVLNQNNNINATKDDKVSNNNDIGNTAKEDVVSNEYYNLTNILELKHKQCGNANEENKDKQFFSTKSLNELCRYCLMAIYSEQHKEECFFIPQWVKEGRSKPFDKIKNFMVFNGHHYLQKTNHDL